MAEHYLKRELAELTGQSPIFEFIQKGSLDGIWYLDIENPEQEWMSPEFKKLFGYEDHEIPNTSEWWQENIHAEDLGTALENFAIHLADPSYAYDQVVRYRHKNGSMIWVRCRGIAIRDDEGKPIRMLGAHTDLTQHKLAQAALERKNDALENFTHAAGHDLRSPVRHILLSLQFLKEDAEGSLSEAVLEHVANAETAGLRLNAVLDGMLELATNEGTPMSMSTVDLGQVTREAIESLGEQIAASGTVVEIGTLPLVMGNAPALLRVMQNLVGNAIKHGKAEGGRVEIGAEKLSERSCEIFVRDDGKGIPEVHRELAFQPFKRLEGRTTKGAGLGLALCADILKRHEGSIRIEDAPDGGASFLLRLARA